MTVQTALIWDNLILLLQQYIVTNRRTSHPLTLIMQLFLLIFLLNRVHAWPCKWLFWFKRFLIPPMIVQTALSCVNLILLLQYYIIMNGRTSNPLTLIIQLFLHILLPNRIQTRPCKLLFWFKRFLVLLMIVPRTLIFDNLILLLQQYNLTDRVDITSSNINHAAVSPIIASQPGSNKTM